MHPHPAVANWEVEQRYSDALRWAAPLRVGLEPPRSGQLTERLHGFAAVHRWTARRLVPQRSSALADGRHGGH